MNAPKTLKHLFAAALLAGLTVNLTARADQEKSGNPDPAATPSATATKAKPYPLKYCVVSDDKFEGSDMKPFEMVHEGQTIKFCCKNCVKDYKKDPKKYLTKLAEGVKKQEVAGKAAK